MVSAPLATVSLKLDLPPPVAIPDIPQKAPVYVTVQTSGAVFVADKASTMESLASDVCNALGGSGCHDERIFVRSEPDVPYRQFMAVMNDLHGHGFLKVGLLNEDIE